MKIVFKSKGVALDCQQVHRNFGNYLKRELPTEDLRWIESHVEDCPDCHLLDPRARRHYLEAHQVLVECR